MVVKTGNNRFYDDFNMGVLKPGPDAPMVDEGTTGLVFHETDNDIVHVFSIQNENLLAWMDQVKKSMGADTGLIVATADQMPKGDPNGTG